MPKKKNTLKNITNKNKINNIHNSVDELFRIGSPNLKQEKKENKFIEVKDDKKFIELKDDEIILDNKPTKIIKENFNPTAIDRDLKHHDLQIMNEESKSDLSKAIDHLSNPVNLESGTILTNRQVIALSVINYLAQVYDVKFFKSFVKTFPRYRISGDEGRGRKEVIEIANAIQKDREEQHMRMMELLGRR